MQRRFLIGRSGGFKVLEWAWGMGVRQGTDLPYSRYFNEVIHRSRIASRSWLLPEGKGVEGASAMIEAGW